MQTIPDLLCYLNGEYTSLAQAKVSVLDRGFIFGDGIYEIVPVYGRKLFRFEEHMARLERNLAKVRIVNPHTRGEWLERCRRLSPRKRWTTSWPTCRSRAAWRGAITSCRRTSSRPCS